MLIHINGMPGVGKLTVSKLLAQNTGIHLVDNHSIINSVRASGCVHGSSDYYRVLKEISEIVYRELALNRFVSDLVLTNCFAQQFTLDQARFDRIQQLALQRNDLFVPVLLTCSLEQNNVRIMSEDRVNNHKLTGILEDNSDYNMIHPKHLPSALSIDTTQRTAEQTAGLILKFVKELKNV